MDSLPFTTQKDGSTLNIGIEYAPSLGGTVGPLPLGFVADIAARHGAFAAEVTAFHSSLPSHRLNDPNPLVLSREKHSKLLSSANSTERWECRMTGRNLVER